MTCCICDDEHCVYLARAVERLGYFENPDRAFTTVDELVHQLLTENIEAYLYQHPEQAKHFNQPSAWSIPQDVIEETRWFEKNFNDYQVYWSNHCWRHQARKKPNYDKQPGWMVSDWVKQEIQNRLCMDGEKIIRHVQTSEFFLTWSVPNPVTEEDYPTESEPMFPPLPEGPKDILVRDLTGSLRDLVTICQFKCSPSDEVVLSNGKTNHEAIVEALKLIEKIGGGS